MRLLILFHILKSKLLLIYLLPFQGNKCPGCKQGFGFKGFRCTENCLQYLVTGLAIVTQFGI